MVVYIQIITKFMLSFSVDFVQTLAEWGCKLQAYVRVSDLCMSKNIGKFCGP